MSSSGERSSLLRICQDILFKAIYDPAEKPKDTADTGDGTMPTIDEEPRHDSIDPYYGEFKDLYQSDHDPYHKYEYAYGSDSDSDYYVGRYSVADSEETLEDTADMRDRSILMAEEDPSLDSIFPYYDDDIEDLYQPYHDPDYDSVYSDDDDSTGNEESHSTDSHTNEPLSPNPLLLTVPPKSQSSPTATLSSGGTTPDVASAPPEQLATLMRLGQFSRVRRSAERHSGSPPSSPHPYGPLDQDVAASIPSFALQILGPPEAGPAMEMCAASGAEEYREIVEDVYWAVFGVELRQMSLYVPHQWYL